jgi:signal transduction histidine kinase
MKLLNYTTAYFALILLLIISVWAGLFYYNMLDEIYDSMDDGLENQKLLVIEKAVLDSSVFNHQNFEDGYYRIKELKAKPKTLPADLYQDTLMFMQNELDFEPVRLLTSVFQHQGKYYELRLITSMVEEDDLIEDLLYSLLWLYLGLLASILILNNFLLKKIWQPFYRLLHRLRNFRLEDSIPISSEPTQILEFRLLNETVENLINTNIETYTSQKNFIENASHELQTPLAISLNKLELLAEGNNLKEKQLAQIGSVMQNLERLTRLNKSLLLLTKIENKQFAPAEEININLLVQKIITDFADQAAYQQINFSLEEKATCHLRLNPDLAQILLVNLIKNALIHNHKGGFVQVIINQDFISVGNSGSEKPLNEKKLFNRFQKENTSPGSTGLGLAIVKAIADLYHFRVNYTYQGQHIFKLHFK